LLHLAVNSETFVDDFHTNDVCKWVLSWTQLLYYQFSAELLSLANTELKLLTLWLTSFIFTYIFKRV
jgi:hypothetical protein